MTSATVNTMAGSEIDESNTLAKQFLLRPLLQSKLPVTTINDTVTSP